MADEIQEKLEERFRDACVFDPILVREEVDEYGDPYLHTYIVYEGDRRQWDPSWMAGLTERILPVSIELGFQSIPMQSYISKSDWLENPHTLQEDW
ncbi:MAG: hypothetical protein J4G06_04770 [Caldilineaceae bacterium]|nr:hypothetical protein [Caldilineaceae bacterium]